MSARDRLAWPLGLCALLALMISGSVALLAIAAAHPDPRVVDDAWLAERALHAELRADRRAREQGVSLALVTERTGSGVRVEARLTDARGRAFRAERIVVRRERPAEGGLDSEFVLEADGGAHRGWIPLPRPGRWVLSARATSGELVASRRVALYLP
jgi:nitrogen fixation protein FixH